MNAASIDSSKLSPVDAVHALDNAIMASNVETIVSLYEEGAFLTPRPGAEARGKQAIRAMYAEFVKIGAQIEQHVERVLEADGIALYLSRWTLTLPDGSPHEAVATVVLRQQADGGWKIVIDNPQGPALLETEEV